MKITEVKAKSFNELQALLGDLKKELFNLRFQKVGGQLTNTMRFRVVRRTIARVKTVLTQLKLDKVGGLNA